ncbi:antitoxin Xre/MbcA/ParS toxin-binding domain-containing protein [Pseudomonas aeruginosa]|uniref:antitoxin Xre/MbcA/ParS toxin-binding domain-containing protein n=1 Tax=Pseudomonas aeruginosa TaxID=287 RepID=UPI0013C4D63D|nr:antitoxin Xre/MbcA/ParS toxin-binding domain-containing protein [Pseudomonas aeruginosa]HBO3146304.1 DUF2384 domain-containing protein [Pseudomonas aeruginosa]HCL4166298.1 DUF2384 domain-containing protein [Pseudomonas aeruginosa]
MSVTVLLEGFELDDAMAMYCLIERGLLLSRVAAFFTLQFGDAAQILLSKILGMSPSALRRALKGSAMHLAPAQGATVIRIAQALKRASIVLGRPGLGVTWLTTPAFGLSNNKPIDMLMSPIGSESVLEYLGQMEYGVYR